MKWGKVLFVVVGAVVLTTFGIDAADTLTGKQGTLLSQVIEGSAGCPAGMVAIANIPSLSCADIYEASPADTCPIQRPENILESNQNIEDGDCMPVSASAAIPWRFITREQAMQACARVGKRLPSSAEWYALGLGIGKSEGVCNTKSDRLSKSGAYPSCTAPNGIRDLVGNVWEWVHGDVINGMYNDRLLPKSGYVVQVDTDGMAVRASSSESVSHGSDYFWSKADGVFGIIRGGYYGSGSDAGVYAVHADIPPNTTGTAVGFRCVQ